jgi:hypothetical protein
LTRAAFSFLDRLIESLERSLGHVCLLDILAAFWIAFRLVRINHVDLWSAGHEFGITFGAKRKVGGSVRQTLLS